MPYTSVGKCVYKKNKSGDRGAKVGCTRGDVHQYLRALYASDPKAAKNYMGVIENIKSSYEKMAEMKHKDFLKQLKEVMKMNKNLQKLHKEYTKDLK